MNPSERFLLPRSSFGNRNQAAERESSQLQCENVARFNEHNEGFRRKENLNLYVIIFLKENSNLWSKELLFTFLCSRDESF